MGKADKTACDQRERKRDCRLAKMQKGMDDFRAA
jgi:hypothetical protein